MDLFDAYYLGTLIEYLRSMSYILPIVKTRKVTEELTVLDTFREVEKILEYAEIEGLIEDKVCYWKNRLGRDYRSNQTLKKKDAEEIRNDAKAMDELLCTEILNRPALELCYRGRLDSKELLRTSEGKRSALFNIKTWKELPKIAKSDFADSATCLLTGASTPAAMVCLRGMEAVIRKYYRTKIGDPKRKGLFDLIDELKKLPNANKSLLGYLDYIRAEKRNFAQHPNRIFTQEEAERVFMQIVNAVHDLYSTSDNLKSQSKSKSL
ncbi:hypothetical protein JW988_02240 [Candidatus Bathyarchaeota archaeon]|nr:hypothetical protein [Candidatus Bathyarchaeota archaeon]